MTTDVINGVPRSLLEGIADHLEWDGSEPMTTIQYAYKCDDLARDLRTLLATAQPADHSEHDLNMVSQPAADGERESDKWADYKKKFCGCKDASRLNSCRGLANCELPANHPERKKPAAQPQQAVAVTDEVRRLREALTELDAVPKQSSHAFPAPSLLRAEGLVIRRARELVTAHKTGEEA